ncbi:PH and SEC7 domain-containing protein isoform X2 [Neodiprion virginianus]|uniref:PH and SEC7 domain-containing protein isoform X2 n=1 Tax=Neodiprion virginianus TaxID=2961670 RepID=UPI001EE6BAD9|nr:PH and SEC7 domain-containing protein isoform X2 [Neodiprion virginianus]
MKTLPTRRPDRVAPQPSPTPPPTPPTERRFGIPGVILLGRNPPGTPRNSQGDLNVPPPGSCDLSTKDLKSNSVLVRKCRRRLDSTSSIVEAGDVILRVNEVDVNRLSTKEVLKCLRLSSDPVTLKLRRDPAIKARVRRLLSPGHPACEEFDASRTTSDTNSQEKSSSNHEGKDHLKPGTPELAVSQPQAHTGPYYATRTNGSYSDASCSSELEALLPQVDSFKEEERAQWEPLSADKFNRQKNPPRFEAYMMTGDLMLNLSRTQQSTGLLPKYQKKVDSLRYNNHHIHHHHNHHNHQHHNSVPTSPNEMLSHRMHRGGAGSNSASTSPVGINIRRECGQGAGSDSKSNSNFGYSSSFVRTSRSEDHLQFQKDPSMSAVDIDIDDDVTSSLNTLLDTRPDSGQGISSERIVWTYNAPVSSPSASERTSCCQNGSSSQSSSSSRSSTEGTSPQRSLSPASPTSVSSSVMSSNSGSRRFPLPTATTGASSGPVGDGTPTGSGVGSISGAGGYFHPTNGDLSQSEAISNMSSPDYNDEETMDILSARDIMMVSDPSDSDSTILASEPPQRRLQNPGYGTNQDSTEHRIVIQVKGPDKEITGSRNNSLRQSRRRGNTATSNASELIPPSQNTQRFQSTVSSGNVTPEFVGYQELKESEDEKEVPTVGDYEEQQHIVKGSSPPQSADEESDIESLHSFHYSPKAVDLPSAIRLAKRLYSLDGFKKSDVSRHLSKNNDFSRAVAEEYLRYFNFEQDTLDVALRKFLAQFSLTGETQERERVLVHFSKRFLDCNPGTFNSQDAVHTLTCAIMLLNTDLHGQNIGRKMSCSEFIENLSELNDGDNFPREVLKQLYNAIKSFPLEWALDDEGDDAASQVMQQGDGPALSGTGNPFLDVPNVTGATEFKKGYVMRKCCYDANGKKTPFGKRGWKMYYCTLRELVLYLHKDEHSFRSDSLHNAIRIHHALATKAADYTKKQHVFRLQTADQAEYLFQTSDSKELQSWIDTINFVCASFSCQPLAGAVGSQRKFQRPLLPCSHTKLSPREQLRDHEEIVSRLEAELDEHRRHPPERNSKALTVQNYKEKDVYLHYELKRYKTYAYLLRSRLAFTDVEPSLVESSIGEVDEGTGNLANTDVALVPPPVPDRLPTNREDPLMT